MPPLLLIRRPRSQRPTTPRPLPQEVTASPISTTGEEEEEIEDEEDEERRREQEEEGEEQYKDEKDFLRPKSESPLHEELDVGTL